MRFEAFKRIGDQIDPGHQRRAVIVRVLQGGGVVVAYAHPGQSNAEAVQEYNRQRASNARRIKRSKRLTREDDPPDTDDAT